MTSTTTTTTPSVSNALLKFYTQSKDKEEAEKLVAYIDALIKVKAKEMMEQYVTNDFSSTEIGQMSAEIREEMNQMRATMNRLSENLTKQFHIMMCTTILTILIPIMLMLLVIYLK